MKYAKATMITALAISICFASYVLGDTCTDGGEKDIEYYAGLTKTRYSSFLGTPYEARGIEPRVLEPLPVIDIYGALQAYLFICYTGLDDPMTLDDAKKLGEEGLGEGFYGSAARHFYGFTITPVAYDLRNCPNGGPAMPPEVYNYSLSEEKAKEVLGVNEVTFLGLVCKFKYSGLLFENNGQKVLVDPKQFNKNRGRYDVSPTDWYYFTWEELKPHISRWTWDSYWFPYWLDDNGLLLDGD